MSLALFSGFKRLSTVPAGSLAKAASVGANTVNGPGPFSVSTRPGRLKGRRQGLEGAGGDRGVDDVFLRRGCGLRRRDPDAATPEPAATRPGSNTAARTFVFHFPFPLSFCVLSFHGTRRKAIVYRAPPSPASRSSGAEFPSREAPDRRPPGRPARTRRRSPPRLRRIAGRRASPPGRSAPPRRAPVEGADHHQNRCQDIESFSSRHLRR